MARFEPLPPGDHVPIQGPRLRLRPVRDDDLDDLRRWRSDPEVAAFYGDAPDEQEARREYLEPGVAPVSVFIVELAGRAVGEIQYWHAYPETENLWSAGIDIFIGERDARDRGVGTEAVRTMLCYLFEEKRLHRVTNDPEVGDKRAIRCYEKAGFRFDGVLRHNAFEHGEFVDTYFMSILEDEWPAAKGAWQDEPAREPGHAAGGSEAGR